MYSHSLSMRKAACCLRLVVLFSLFACASSNLFATNFYVRTNGNNSNSGTGTGTGAAWQTLGHALNSSSVQPGDTIYVRTGTYNESTHVNRDGTNGNPIRIIADTTGATFGGGGGEVVVQAVAGSNPCIWVNNDEYLEFYGFKFIGNGTAGGIYFYYAPGSRLVNCEVTGGGSYCVISVGAQTDVLIKNCLIHGNANQAVWLSSGSMTIWNTTIVDNGAMGVLCSGGAQSMTVTNSIIANNGGAGFVYNGGTLTHTYNLLYGNALGNYDNTSASTGEIQVDPLFVSGSDYHLQAGSPAIDAGTNAAGTVDDDLDGTARPSGSGWDMGCYELPGLYYVRSDGNNSNSGTGPTAGEAWATVEYAATQSLAPGDTVYVRAGTYVGNIVPTVAGSSGNPISFIADRFGTISGWSAGDVILSAQSDMAIKCYNDDYLHFTGFKIDANSINTAVRFNSSVGCRLMECEIYEGSGHGVYISSSGEATLVNCLIRDNASNGVICATSGSATVWNCTIVNNGLDGVRHWSTAGASTVTNCIIANNASNGIRSAGGGITSTYNNLFNSSNYANLSAGTGDVQANPRFRDTGDYRLRDYLSPAINSGTSATGIADLDMDGVARPQHGNWDMGCFEGDGLIGHWKLDETSGTVAADSSLNGRDGNVSGTTSWVSGTYDGALEQATSARVTIPGLMGEPKNFTVAAWANLDQASADGGDVISVGGYILLRMDETAGGRGIMTSFFNGSIWTQASSYVFAEGKGWRHIAGTFDDDANTLKLYIDGTLVTTVSTNKSIAWSTRPYTNTLLGSHTNYSSYYFQGQIDDARIYNYSLSEREIAELYGLMGHWKLDEMSGTVAADSTVFGNDGTLHNGAAWNTVDGSKAVTLDGTNDYISLGNPDELNFTGKIAMSAWINPHYIANPGFSNIIEHGFQHGPDRSTTLRMYNGDYEGGSWSPDEFTSKFPIPSRDQQNWVHLVLMYDGANWKLYRNGELIGTFTGPYGARYVENIGWAIGARGSGDTRFFNGDVRDVRIYNRPLTVGEVNTLYGRLAYWKLDETSGTVAVDSAERCADATYVSTPTLGASGPHAANTGTAVELNGSSESITVGKSLVNSLSAFTLTGWVNTDALGVRQSFFGQNNAIELGLDPSGQLHGWTANGGQLTVPGQFSANEWNHVTFTGDGTELKLYVNGLEVLTGGSAIGSSYGASSNHFKLGEGVWDPTGHYYDGRFDDVQVFGRSLSPNEIFNIYKGSRPSGVRIIEWVELR